MYRLTNCHFYIDSWANLQLRQAAGYVRRLAFNRQRPHHHRWIPRVIAFRNRHPTRVRFQQTGGTHPNPASHRYPRVRLVKPFK